MAERKTTKTSKVKNVQFLGTGRRKKSIARVRLLPNGTGKITVNGKDIEEYFGLDTLKLIVRQPMELTNTQDKYDVMVNVIGGGLSGQAGEDENDEKIIAVPLNDPACNTSIF